MTSFSKVHLILRSIYLKGHQDGNLKVSDMSWEDKALASLAEMVRKEKKHKAFEEFDSEREEFAYNRAIDHIAELFESKE